MNTDLELIRNYTNALVTAGIDASQISDGLDSAFDCLPLFKKTDPEHYKMFSRIGCSVMSKDAIFSAERTANFKKLPSFGCFHLPNRFGSFAMDDETKQMMVNDRSDDDIVAQLCFMFFSKQKTTL
jgi:hypothetical protein